MSVVLLLLVAGFLGFSLIAGVLGQAAAVISLLAALIASVFIFRARPEKDQVR